MAPTYAVYERVDEVLDSEDGIILLVDRRHATSYAQGFALSGCQIELLSVEVERAVRALALVTGLEKGGSVMTNRTTVVLISVLTARLWAPAACG